MATTHNLPALPVPEALGDDAALSLPNATLYEHGADEPAPGIAALLMHPNGHIEYVYFRDDQVARDGGYDEGQRWWAVGDDTCPATWPEVAEDHDGSIFLVRVPVLVP